MNLARLAGNAGIGAGLAYLWLHFGSSLIARSLGVSSFWYGAPDEILNLFAAGTRARLFWLVTIPGGLLLSILTMILCADLGRIFRRRAPTLAPLGAVLCVSGAMTAGVLALIPQLGYSTLAAVYVEDRQAAIAAFHALRALIDALEGWTHVALGLGILAFGLAMAPQRGYRAEGYLGVGAGITYTAAVVALSSMLHFVANLLAILWLMSTGLALRSEEPNSSMEVVTSSEGGRQSNKPLGEV